MALLGDVAAFGGGALGIKIVIGAVDEFSKVIKSAEKGFAGLSKELANFGKKAGIAIAGFTALSVKKFAEEEIEIKRLNFLFGDLADSVISNSELMARSSALSSDEIKRGFLDTALSFETLGIGFSEQSKIIQGALDLSAASGQDFNQVLDIIVNTLNGRVSPAAKALGINVDAGALEGLEGVEKLDFMLKALKITFQEVHGAAKAEVGSVKDILSELEKQVNDVSKAFGEGFVDGLKEASGAANDLTESELFDTETWETLGDALGAVTVAIIKFIEAVVKGIKYATIMTRGSFELSKSLITGKPLTEAWGESMNFAGKSLGFVGTEQSRYNDFLDEYKTKSMQSLEATKKFDNEFENRLKLVKDEKAAKALEEQAKEMAKIAKASEKEKIEIKELNDKIVIAAKKLQELTAAGKQGTSAFLSAQNTFQNLNEELARYNDNSLKAVDATKSIALSLVNQVQPAIQGASTNMQTLNNQIQEMQRITGAGLSVKQVSLAQALNLPPTTFAGMSAQQIETARVEQARASSQAAFGGGVTTGGRLSQGGRLKLRDFISRPGMPAQSFSPTDTIIGVKDPAKLGGGTVININVEGSLTSMEDLTNRVDRILADRLRNKVSVGI